MDRQSLLVLALALLAVAGLVVSASGWVLFARSRRAAGPPADEGSAAEEELDARSGTDAGQGSS